MGTDDFLGPALWLHGPQTPHSWKGIKGKGADIVVVHTSSPITWQQNSLGEKPSQVIDEHGAWMATLPLPEAQRIGTLIKSVAEDYHRPTPHGQLRLQHVALQLWLFAADTFEGLFLSQGDNNILKTDVVSRSLTWYREHLAEGPSVEEVAESVRLSASQLRRRFADAERLSPLAEMHAIQFEVAELLLVETDEPILDVAIASGFRSASVFSRVFRDHSGMTPRDFRNTQRQK